MINHERMNGLLLTAIAVNKLFAVIKPYRSEWYFAHNDIPFLIEMFCISTNINQLFAFNFVPKKRIAIDKSSYEHVEEWQVSIHHNAKRDFINDFSTSCPLIFLFQSIHSSVCSLIYEIILLSSMVDMHIITNVIDHKLNFDHEADDT